MQNNNAANNIRWGVILSYVSLAVSLLGALFVSNRVLHYIGDYYYGLYTFVGSITSWLTVLSSALVASYLRFAAIDAKENNSVEKVNALFFKIFSVLGAVVITVGCSVILFFLYNRRNFRGYSWEDSALIYSLFFISIVNIGITFITTVYSQYINYNQRFFYEKGKALIISIAGFTAHYCIARYTGNIILFAVYALVETGISFLCNFMYCKNFLSLKFTKVEIKREKKILGEVIAFSSILILNSIVDQINTNVDKTLLGIFAIPEFITMYQMGQLFQSYLASVVSAVSGVFAPRIHNLCAINDDSAVNSLFTRISRLQGMLVCFIGLAFVCCGKHFIYWWLGTRYTAAYHVGAVLMVLSIMPLSVKLSIEVQRARNMHRFRSFLFFAVAMLNILISILFLMAMPKKYAIYACLLGTIISNILCQWVCMNIYNSKKMHLPMGKHLRQLARYVAYGISGCITANTVSKVCLSIFDAHYFTLFIIEAILYTMVYLTLVMLFDRDFILSFRKHG